MSKNKKDLIKVVHIHTDRKFIYDTSRFDGNIFENDIVLLSKSKIYSGSYDNNIVLLDISPKAIRTIIRRCEGADLVVLYGLDYFKSRIALGLPDSIAIAWRFFGNELYHKKLEMYLSETSLQTLKFSRKQKLKKLFQEIYLSFKHIIKWGCLPNNYYTSTVNRLNFIFCVCEQEYDHLLSIWPELPQFIRFSISDSFPRWEQDTTKNKKLLIIGNNKSSYNNSLDIIKIIESIKIRELYQFKLLQNYGAESNYVRKTREMVRGKPYFYIIESFMTMNKFYSLYDKAAAAVFNGYRQMALANIFTALNFGVKLYLNDKNIIKEWLRSKGFLIYSVDDLGRDLENKKIVLSKKEMTHNLGMYQELINSYTHEDFQKSIYYYLKGESYNDQYYQK